MQSISRSGYKALAQMQPPLMTGDWKDLVETQRTDGFGFQHRPQINFGYGGWGSYVIKMLMEEISSYLEAAHIRARFFEIDSSDINTFLPDELIYLGDVPIHDLLTEMKQDPQAHPELRKYIGDPQELFELLKGITDNSQGAEGAPDLGTLIALAQLNWGRVNIDHKLNTLFNELFYYATNSILDPAPPQHQPDFVQPLTAFTATSLPGGTGGPTFEAYTFHIRQRLKEDGAKNVQNIAILAMAGSFVEVTDKDLLYRNNVRALTALWSKYQGGTHPPLQFSLSSPINRDAAPFSIVYLIDGTNKNHYRFKDSNQVADVTAQGMRMMSCGEIAKTYAKYLQNVIPKTIYPYIASSFGAYTVAYDGDGLMDQFGHWMGVDLLQASFLQQPSAKVTQLASADAYLQYCGIKDLSDPLSKTTQGKPLEVAQVAPVSRRKQVVTNMVIARRQQAKYLAEQLASVVEAQATAQISRLRTYVEGLIHQPGGLMATVQMLKTVVTALAAFSQELEDRIDDTVSQATLRAEALHTDATTSWYRRAWPRPQFQSYSKALLADEFHHARDIAYRAIVERVVVEAQAQIISLMSWHQDLAEFVRQLEYRAQALIQARQPTSPVVESVLGTEEERPLYGRYRPQPLAQLLSSRPRLMWDKSAWILRYSVEGEAMDTRVDLLSDAGFARHLSFCRAPFTFVADWSIEEVLNAKAVDPQRFVAALIERSAPLISLDLSRNNHRLSPLIVIAAPDGTTEFFSSVTLEEGVLLVASGDKAKIDVLNSIHGFTWEAISYAPAMIRAYEQADGSDRVDEEISGPDELPEFTDGDDLPF